MTAPAATSTAAESARQCVLLYLPAVQDVHFVQGPELKRVPDTDFFAWDGAPDTLPAHYRLEWTDSAGAVHSQVDPYCFLPTIDEQSLAAFNAALMSISPEPVSSVMLPAVDVSV